jgi:hypothetical protein
MAAALFAAGCKPAGPRVQIVSPTRGAVVSGNVMVALRASSGVRVVPADGSRKAGEGHFHVLVDMGPPGGDSVIGTGRGIYHLGTGTDRVNVSLAGLAPGTHYLVGVLAYGDHLPLKEVAADTVRIVVRLP